MPMTRLTAATAAAGASRDIAVLLQPSGTGARALWELRRLMPALLRPAIMASTAAAGRSPTLLSLDGSSKLVLAWCLFAHVVS